MAQQGHDNAVNLERGTAGQPAARRSDAVEERERRIAELRAQHGEGCYELDELTLAAALVDRHLRPSF